MGGEGGNGGTCREKGPAGYRCTLDRGHGGTYHEARTGIVVRRWDRSTLPPAQDFGQYAAAMAEHVRSLLGAAFESRAVEAAVRASAGDLLARWDAGQPYGVVRHGG
jgi:hypothetical protein